MHKNCISIPIPIPPIMLKYASTMLGSIRTTICTVVSNTSQYLRSIVDSTTSDTDRGRDVGDVNGGKRKRE
jgi:hypothetical protein